MIVKNEEKVIIRCLESVLPFIDTWVICDTGSTDRTREVITEYFKEKNIPGQLFNHEWENFGTNRTLALMEAQGTKVQDLGLVHYILIMDADDDFFGRIPRDLDPEIEGWFIPLRSGGMRYDRMCLVRADLKWGYRGVLHEHIYCKTKESLTTDHICTGYINRRASGTRSYENDALVLTKALEDTRDLLTRYTFYTAQSYYDAHLFDKALHFYKERVNLGGWRDEVYYSLFRIAEIEQTETAYLDAYKHSPHRAEPLHALAKMFRLKNDFKTAYAYALLAKRIPSPPVGDLFVSQNVYDWEIDDELAISAYWIGNIAECKSLCEQLLLNDKVPENQRFRIRKNALYADKRFSFTEHWFLHVVDGWIQHILPLRDREQLNYLEIGSFEGMSAVWVCDNLPNAHITCIDPFSGSIEHDNEQKRNLYERFHRNVVVNFPSRITVFKQKSSDALPHLSNSNELSNSFDIIYIDGDHHADAVYQDAKQSWSLLKDGGMMIFDDYLWIGCDSVKLGIDAFLTEVPHIMVHNGYQIMIKKHIALINDN